MMESVRLLQNGFASLDIIREARGAADVPERKKCEKLRKHWERIWEKKVLTLQKISPAPVLKRKTHEKC